MMITHIVKPDNVQEYDFKQSKYETAPRLPLSQTIMGPSGSGKGILLQSMILDIYRDVFERIYVWSPSNSVDSNWFPSKRYLQDHLKVHIEKEKCLFDEYIPPRRTREGDKATAQSHRIPEKERPHKIIFDTDYSG